MGIESDKRHCQCAPGSERGQSNVSQVCESGGHERTFAGKGGASHKPAAQRHTEPPDGTDSRSASLSSGL